MRIPLAVLPLLALSGSLLAQNPRDTVLLGDSIGTARGPAVSSQGDLSVATYLDESSQAIMAAFSDGRGIDWTAPKRVDEGNPSRKEYFSDGLLVHGVNVFLYWLDDRLSVSGSTKDLYYNFSFSSGTGFHDSDIAIPRGLPKGSNDVKDVRMSLSGGDPADPHDDILVFLVASERTATGDEELYFNYSADGGHHWDQVGIAMTAHNGFCDVDEIDVVIDGTVIHAIWADDFNGTSDDVWYSAYDTAAKAFLARDVLLNTSTSGTHDVDFEVSLAVRNGTVAAAWEADLTANRHETWASVSTDNGATWSGDVRIGGYVAGADDVDNPVVAVAGNGNVVVVWEDDRSGGDEAYASTSSDGGVTWSGDALLSSSGAGFPELEMHGDMVAACWTSGSFPNFFESALSRDGGATWNPPVTGSQNAGDVDFAVMAWNDRYDNVLAAWLCDELGANDAYAGGYRPQTLTPVGDFGTPGTPVSFSISGWPAADHGKQFGVLVSASPGAAILPNGLNTGLLRDRVMTIALSRIPGDLSGTIQPDGSGSTPTISAPPLPGTLLAAAFAFTSPADTGALTDLVPIP